MKNKGFHINPRYIIESYIESSLRVYTHHNISGKYMETIYFTKNKLMSYNLNENDRR